MEMKMLSVLLLVVMLFGTETAQAAKMNVKNNCAQTIWAASLKPSGGQELTKGQTWTVDVPANTEAGRIWARTGCNFGGGSGQACKTGDCAGALQCTVSGTPPATLVEYTTNGGTNKDQDFYDLSLVDGFNLAVSVTPTKAGGSANCTTISCKADINANCPAELKVDDGCKSACAAFPNRDDYCCNGKYNSAETCPPFTYSKYFKNACPDAYSYAKDDQTSTFTCPSGSTDYNVVFCP
eukprot:TRINITY_DN3690_c0_g2_i1.p2 TRINITY_DN3690_c0_g2~~TRINITY_DN3690_c0_g2_i1.p2  ORF type:complete len:238 (+),score=16.75 TRINITY_DN3690_c0_g2_i1:43-756(+)